MKKYVTDFTNQLTEAIAIGEQASLRSPSGKISNVIISGLGGSGIGGSLIAKITAQELKIPLAVNNDYSLPAYCGPETLLIVCSYSGNTEETVCVMEAGIKSGAQIVCVTSGGKILELAKAASIDFILIPGGMPPRACLGYSFTQLFFILNHFKLIGSGFKSELKASITMLDEKEEEIKEQAFKVACCIVDKIPVLYSSADSEAIAIRFRQQLNENSKILCWHHVFPEMNHNELVGWTKKNDDLAVIFLRNDSDNKRIQSRMEICRDIFLKHTPTLIELHAKGNSQLEKALYLVHLCDWISCSLADLKKIDPVEVSVIDYLKSSLAKM